MNERQEEMLVLIEPDWIGLIFEIEEFCDELNGLKYFLLWNKFLNVRCPNSYLSPASGQTLQVQQANLWSQYSLYLVEGYLHRYHGIFE